MRTAANIVGILLLGVAFGLLIRIMPHAKDSGGPGPDDTVYTNDGASTDADLTFAEIENPEPARPPEDEAWLSRFELIERSGEKVSSEDLLGQPYVVSFFFSTCPSICIQQNQKLKPTAG